MAKKKTAEQGTPAPAKPEKRNGEVALKNQEIPPEVAEKLGHYVYLYVDPRDEKIRYVGKGWRYRGIAHLFDRDESKKVAWINELRDHGYAPRIDILAHGLKDEDAALLVERCVIDAIGVENLTNKVSGHGTEREPLHEIVIRESAEPVTIQHPVLLFRIQSLFKLGMSECEIYDITRGVWNTRAGVSKRWRDARYALGVVDGVVRGVFEISRWHDAGSTEYKYGPQPDPKILKGRREFTQDNPVPQKVVDLYLHKSVRKYLGGQNPVIFVPGDK